MGPRDAFLQELETRTRTHLRELASESGEVFARYVMLPDKGPRIYERLVETFQMDGAQEIAACLVDLVSGSLDNGTVMVSEREYQGLKYVADQFADWLPDGPRRSLENLVWTLSKATRR
jgi:hypothetical protein